jgi:hypothetical protein
MQQGNFDTLREKLLEHKKWPLLYMFKFIVPNKDGNVDKLVGLLPDNGKTSFKNTKNLKYVSITCVASMAAVDDIIYTTKQALMIEGVMSL